MLAQKNDYDTAFFSSESNIIFDDIFRSKKMFIVAEPGNVRTRLLRDSLSTIKFKNTEFQEYLATKKLLRLGKTDQIILISQ